MISRLNLRILLILLIVALVLVVPAYAQETTPAVEPTAAVEAPLPETRPIAGVADEGNSEATNGVTTLVLLVGLGAIGVVGFGTLMRENYQPPQNNQ